MENTEKINRIISDGMRPIRVAEVLNITEKVLLERLKDNNWTEQEIERINRIN
jgi:hypothetical protein